MSPTGRFVTIVPFTLILILTALKEIVEDIKRHRADDKVRRRVTLWWRLQLYRVTSTTNERSVSSRNFMLDTRIWTQNGSEIGQLVISQKNRPITDCLPKSLWEFFQYFNSPHLEKWLNTKSVIRWRSCSTKITVSEVYSMALCGSEFMTKLHIFE